MDKYRELVNQINLELNAAEDSLKKNPENDFTKGCRFAYRSLMTKIDILDHDEQIQQIDAIIKRGGDGAEVLRALGIIPSPTERLYGDQACLKTVTEVKESPKKEVIDIPKSYISTRDMVKAIGVTNVTICNWARSGMPFITVPGHPGRYFNLDECIKWITKNKPEFVKQQRAKGDTDDYTIWRKDIASFIRSYGLDVKQMLIFTYNELTRDYGIVWDQEKKDFQKKHGYFPKSTLEVAYELDRNNVTKKLFEDRLMAVCERNKKEEN